MEKSSSSSRSTGGVSRSCGASIDVERGHDMAEYVPSPRQWVRDQVELYEGSGGKEGTTLRDTGPPVIIVTHNGKKNGAIRKTKLMRVKEGQDYVLVCEVDTGSLKTV